MDNNSNNNSNNNSSKGTTLIMVFLLVCMMGACGSCTSSSSSSSYDKTFESGMQKYYSGEKMTEKEYKAVQNYNKWKEKNSSKTYSDWSK